MQPGGSWKPLGPSVATLGKTSVVNCKAVTRDPLAQEKSRPIESDTLNTIGFVDARS
jgi:hypothetical protein